MNNRIHELISAYLHRGSTPEQERELFDACSRNPETAELLRQHLVLSLKLRQLRDETEVPPALHNHVLRRINTMEAEGVREEERQAAAVPPITTQASRRFGWMHLLGTGFAGAAVVALLLFATNTAEPDLASQVVPATPDTVVMVRTDTLTREIERPVYIVRNTAPKATPDQHDADAPEQIAQQTLPVDAPAQVGTDNSGRQVDTGTLVDSRRQNDSGRQNDSRTQNDTGTQEGSGLAGNDRVPPVISPALADNLPSTTASREEKTQNYLEQYTSMLVSVESVRLSTQDRLH